VANNRFLRWALDVFSHNAVRNGLAVLAIVLGIVATGFSILAASIIFGLVFVGVVIIAVYAFHVRGERREIYQVLRCDATWEIEDTGGQCVVFTKDLKVRFLQNHVLAIDDPAWGDGALFAEYDCRPGAAVDRFRLGSQYHTVISLREFRNRGDVLDFQIRRKIVGGFTQAEEWVEMDVGRAVGPMSTKIVFPAARKPARESICWLARGEKQVHAFADDALRYLPDGRQELLFDVAKPRTGEVYVIKWRW